MVLLGAAVFMAPAQSVDTQPWTAVISSANRLAEDSRYVEAERLLQSALKHARLLQPDSLPAAMLSDTLGGLYRVMHRCEEAAKAYHDSLRTWERVAPPPSTRSALVTADSLVGLYAECGDLHRAEYAQHVLVRPRMEALQQGDPEYARILGNLGSIELLRHRYRKAALFYEEALKARAPQSSEGSVDAAGIFNNLALALIQSGRSQEAIEYSRRAITALESGAAPRNSSPLVMSLLNAAEILCRVHRPSEALPLMERALELARVFCGEDDVLMAAVMMQYSTVLKLCNRQPEAKVALEEARRIRATSLRPPEARTVDIQDLPRRR